MDATATRDPEGEAMTTTATIFDQPTDAKALAVHLRASLGLKGSRSRHYAGALRHIAMECGYGDRDDWPYAVTVAMLGIEHALNTGRVSGQVRAEILGLSDWRACGLVADIAVACENIGDVPGYLNRRFA
jgi:hypothetical protein